MSLPKSHICKKKFAVFSKTETSISSWQFGVRQSFWYVGLRTRRDLFISGVFGTIGDRWIGGILGGVWTYQENTDVRGIDSSTFEGTNITKLRLW